MQTTASRRRWHALVGALVGAVAGTLVLASGTVLSAASAAPAASADSGRSAAGHHRHAHHRPGYLALGDSVAFGYRPPEVVTPPTLYLDAANFVGYPEVLAGRAHLHLVNASCPGETTGSMIDATAQSYACENLLGLPGGYRTQFPLHASYQGSQLDFAVHYLRRHPHTRLVSIDIGANDVFACQAVTADKCTGSDFAAVTAQVEDNLDTILGALRHRAHYHHRLVVLTYYSLDYADPVGTAGIEALNAALVRAAQAHRAAVADGFGAFEAAAAPAGGDVCAAGLIIALPAGGCNVHPTLEGQRILATAVRQVAGRLHAHGHWHR
jgi:lysophospholipase L1-like esterase